MEGNVPSDRIIDLIYQKEYAINSIWNIGPYIKPALDGFRSVYVKLRDDYRRAVS